MATNRLQVKLGTQTLLQRFASLMMIFNTEAHDNLDHVQQSELHLTDANIRACSSQLPTQSRAGSRGWAAQRESWKVLHGGDCLSHRARPHLERQLTHVQTQLQQDR